MRWPTKLCRDTAHTTASYVQAGRTSGRLICSCCMCTTWPQSQSGQSTDRLRHLKSPHRFLAQSDCSNARSEHTKQCCSLTITARQRYSQISVDSSGSRLTARSGRSAVDQPCRHGQIADMSRVYTSSPSWRDAPCLHCKTETRQEHNINICREVMIMCINSCGRTAVRTCTA